MRKKYLVFLIILFLINYSYSQLSNEHYLPPLKQIINNQAIRQQAFYLSTPETTAFNVLVYQGINPAPVATLIGLSNTNPIQYNIANGDNNITLVTNANTGIVLSNSGLRFESVGGEDFYVNYRGRSSAQATSLTSKGRQALGTSFKWGGIPNRATNTNLTSTLGIMATEDGTTVNIFGYDPDCEFRLAGDPDGITDDTIQIMLNAGQTFVLEARKNETLANIDGWLGASIQSDKKIAISNGGLNTGVRNGAQSRDAAIDQPVPENVLGREYVFVRGNGTNETEFPIIIGTQNGTDIFVNGSATPIATINNGEYFEIPGANYSNGSAGANMYVTTSKETYAYQSLAGSSGIQTIGLNFIAPVNCLLPNNLESISDIRDVDGLDFNGGVTIIASTTTPDGNITVTDGTGPVTIPASTPVAGTTEWKTFYVPGLTGNVSVQSTGPIAVGFLGVNSNAGIAGYFSGFDSVPVVELDVTGGGCLPGSDVFEISGTFDAYQWFQNGLSVPGATTSTFAPTEPGDFFVRVTRGSCTYDSAILSVYNCDPEIVISKTVDNSSVLEGDNVTFTITVEHLGIDPVTNLVINDVLPPELSFVSGTPSFGAWSAPDWTIGNMFSGEVHTLEVVASVNEVNATVTVTNTINNTQTEVEADVLPDDPTEDITITNSDITITKQDQAPPDGSYDTVGEVITYNFVVENTGDVPLSNVTITDSNIDLGSLSPISVATLAVGATTNFTATHTITQADIEADQVINSATVTAELSNGFVISDISDDPDDPTTNIDDPTITPIDQKGELILEKIAQPASDGLYDAIGEVIQYELTVFNTGNVSLNNVSITDPFADPGSISPVSIANLPAGTSAVFTAQHTLVVDDFNAGNATNMATVSGTEVVEGTVITDTSDDPTTTAPNDATVVTIPQFGQLNVTKVDDAPADGSFDTVGETITYTIVVESVGTVTVTNINIVDPNADTITLQSTTGTDAGGDDIVDSMDPGDTATFIVTHVLTQDDLDAGQVINTATAGGQDPAGGSVTDLSDDPDNPNNNVDDPTVTILGSSPSMQVTKLADDDTDVVLNQTITYTYQISNNGNVTFDNVSLSDVHLGSGTLSAILLQSTTGTDSGGDNIVDALAPGQVAIFESTYLVTQIDIDNQADIVNTATATGTPRTGSLTDPSVQEIVTVITEAPSMEATKTQVLVDDGDGDDGVGDTINYTIRVENTGNVTLTGVALTDTFVDGNGNPLTLDSGPDFDNGSLGSLEGTLQVGETATYLASYVITQAAVDAGGVSNSVLAEGTSPQGTGINDTSDDGDDTDGNTVDDTTDFTITEAPSMEATKTQVLVDDGDGDDGVGDTINYTIRVENTGNVTLTGVALTDTFVDGNGNPLTLDSGPDFDNGSLGSLEGTLQVGETATYLASYVITQAAVDAGGVSNSVLAEGTSPQGTGINDTSDDGDDTDGNTVDDTTDFTITEAPSMEATKTQVLVDDGDGDDGVGDTINYTIRVENTGNVTLTGVALTDTFVDGNGNPLTLDSGPDFDNGSLGSLEGTLQVGETATYLASYVITQAAVDAGGVSNSVLAEGTSPQGTGINDTSDDGDDTDGNTVDDTTDFTITEAPSMEATKTQVLVDDGDGDDGVGDTINYTIRVENTGNVTLTGVALTDTFVDGNGNPLTLDSGPDFDNGSLGSLEGTLQVGETATYLASYVITQAAVDAGGVSNSVLAEGTSPQGTGINDTSDDGDDTDGNTVDDTTDFTITEAPSMEATKTQVLVDDGDGDDGVGDTINYTIRVENTGNVTLTGVALTDTFVDGNGNPLTLDSGPDFDNGSLGSLEGTLQVGETATYLASYVITQAAVDAGGVSNSVLAEGTSPQGTGINDTSDDGDDTDGNTVDDTTDFTITEAPSMEATKTQVLVDDGDGDDGVGDTINYTIRVENTGNVTLTGVALTDTFVDGNGNPLTLDSGPDFDNGSLGSLEGTLQVGETATYLASYVITQAAVDAGGVSNSVLAEGTSPQGTGINDTSDDGDDTDGNTVDDTTDFTITEAPSMEATKTQVLVDDGDGDDGVGDTINYTIRVENTGNVTLTGVALTDTFVDGNGNPLTLDSGPDFDNGSLGSLEGTLQVGETATYLASYVITQAAVDAGGVSNSVLAEGTSPQGTGINDTSDDGDDTDGNTVDDTTDFTITEAPSMEATKTQVLVDDGDGDDGVGDTINYTIRVENTGNVTLTGVALTDTFVDGNGNPLTLDSGPDFDNGSLGSLEGTLQVGETATYLASYVITQAAVDAGGVSNSVLAEGTSPQGTGINDTSDDGDDTDGNTVDDTTDFTITEAPSMEATKTQVLVDDGDGDDGVGDTINYTIRVENTGNVTLTGVALTDTFVDGNGNPLTLDSGPDFDNGSLGSLEGTLQVGETATYLASYVITQAAVDAGGVSNSVLAEGTSPQGTGINDTSDDGDDTDGNTVDDTTDFTITEAPSMEATKTQVLVDDGDGDDGVGDTINYTIRVENTGNVTLTGVALTDTFVDGNGNPLTLDSGPDFDNGSLGSLEGTLQVGETATYLASYVITQAAVDAGGVSNSVLAEGTSPQGTGINDTSDDGDDTDGNTVDDTTDFTITEAPSMEATKTQVLVDDGDGDDGVGDTINYTIRVENTGNVTLTGVALTDTFVDGNGNPLTLDSGPDFDNGSLGSLEGTLQVGETATYLASYVITQAAVDAGGVSNSVLAEGTSPQGTGINDTSDDGDDTDGNTVDDTTDFTITEAPSMEATKTQVLVDDGDGDDGVGDTINYTIRVENTGNVTLTGVALTDTFVDGNGNPLTLDSGPDFDNGSLGSLEGTLQVGETATYLASYVITQAAVDAGGVSNSVLAEGTSPQGTGINDTSDDGDDTDGNTVDDTTDFTITEAPSMEATKTQVLVDDGDGDDGVGDTINYTIRVENTGNVTLTGVALTDTFVDGNGNPLTLDSGPDFDNGSLGSLEGTLQVGETATYLASYVITQAAVDAGGVSNSVLAEGTSPQGTGINDTSDDGDDTDGNTVDDTTDFTITPNPDLTFIKTSELEGAMPGDIITYTFSITNTGNLTINNITIDDPLTGSVNLVVNPSTLAPGEEGTASATYTLTQADINLGEVMNSATVIGQDPLGNDVIDISDSGDELVDEDGNGDPTNDPTITQIEQLPNLALIKIGVFVDTNNDGLSNVGDEIQYTFTVTNTGNVDISNITLSDPLPGVVINGGSIDLAVGETDESSFTAVYTITANDLISGNVTNQALVTGQDPNGEDVTDLSDDPLNDTDVDIDNDGDFEDETVTDILTDDITIYTGLSPNGDGINDEFRIVGLQSFPRNNLQIFNRWGVKVFDLDGYEQPGVRFFVGISEGRTTISKNRELPVGTYYYVLRFEDSEGITRSRAGYLYINR